MFSLPTLSNYPQIKTLPEPSLWTEMLRDPVSFQKGIQVRTLLLVPQAVAAAPGTARVFPGAYRYLLATYANRAYRESLDPRQFSTIAQEIIRRTEEHPEWIDHFTGQFNHYTERLQRLAEDTQYSFTTTDFHQLSERFSQLYDAAVAAGSFGYLTEVFGDYSWVYDYIHRLAPDCTQADIELLLKPVTPSFLAEYHNRLIFANTESALQAVIHDYYFVKGSYNELPELTLTLAQADQAKISPITEDFKRLREQKAVLIAASQQPEALRNFIHLIEACIAMQDQRKANVLHLNYAFSRVLSLACLTQNNWTVDQLLSCTPHEIVAWLNGQSPDRELIARRDQKSAWIFSDKGYYLSTDPAVVQPLFTLFEHSDATLISGKTAFGGTAIGTVKIVLSEDDFDKVEEGDIIVAWMTRPEYLPVIKKAAVIITNEGGITCHAAIIARELKKPCLIGTKNATNLLKDGDLVKVDADRAEITLLPRPDLLP